MLADEPEIAVEAFGKGLGASTSSSRRSYEAINGASI
jgi:hypothetical protein